MGRRVHRNLPPPWFFCHRLCSDVTASVASHRKFLGEEVWRNHRFSKRGCFQILMPMIDQHCREIDRCNQRGGRMLSAVDLLDAGTLDLDLAANLAAAISGGASFLVGAVPGGAGKTTIMAALLNFLPADVPIVTVDGAPTIQPGAPRACYLCHEIGSGAIFSYLWGDEARDFFALTQRGHIVATNLHCDTIEQTRRQLCRENPVDEADFRRVNLMMFITFDSSGAKRQQRLASVWHSDGEAPHRLIWRWEPKADTYEQVEALDVEPNRVAALRELLEQLVRDDARTIRQVRRRVVEFLKNG